MDFELPDDIQKEYGVEISVETKCKILGENAARLYGIDIPVWREKLSHDTIGTSLVKAT